MWESPGEPARGGVVLKEEFVGPKETIGGAWDPAHYRGGTQKAPSGGTKHRVRRGNVMHEVVTGAVLLSDGVVVSGGV